MRRKTVIVATVLMLMMVGILGVAAASAQEQELINVPITILHGDPGEIIVVAVIPADPGVICTVTFEYINKPDSLHADTNIMVGPLTYYDVESGNAIRQPTRQFETAGDITVAVQIGEDGVTSGGFRLVGPCGLPPTPTTTTTTPGATTTTSTTTPPPVDGINTGGGACADGACDGRPVWMLPAVFGLAALSAAAFGQWLKSKSEET